ncbi:hypothetical protein MSG28_007929 [Choristoneura fumiferana]|uniref:Uncharacterized protein n=1 Tax=Choristoneura fumiferana TaxID=7141 RepID=A0ACC0J9A2_CHOFU|nr:hypothetical protein MSG28_007929 [Choristoneura fumiferana]
MRWLVVICLVSVASCHPTQAPEQEKGFIDWVNQLLGATSTTTLRPTQDPPDDCPSCHPPPCVHIAFTHDRYEYNEPRGTVLVTYRGGLFLAVDLFRLTILLKCSGGVTGGGRGGPPPGGGGGKCLRSHRSIGLNSFHVPRMRHRADSAAHRGRLRDKTKELPWMAVLMYNGRFYCGGSLLNDLYVLTAAHCTSGFRKERMSVRFLEHDRSNPNETKTIDRKVQAIIRHLRYNPGTYDNDIALLKLDQRVDLSNALKRIRSGDDESSGEEGNDENDEDDEEDVGLRPVCLPTASKSYDDYTAMVSGWGTTEEGGSVSNTLQETFEDQQLFSSPIKLTDSMRRKDGILQ